MNSPNLSKNMVKSNYKDMYKSPSTRKELFNNPGDNELDKHESPWRNAYKKRCFDEFKKSRSKLVNKFRTLNVIVLSKSDCCCLIFSCVLNCS